MKESIKQFFSLYLIKLKVKLSIKMADYKHYITNKRYYVIPFTDGGLMVVNNDDIKTKKKEGLIKKNDNHISISEKALYWTPVYRGNSLSYEERLKMAVNYRRWLKVAGKLKIGNPTKQVERSNKK